MRMLASLATIDALAPFVLGVVVKATLLLAIAAGVTLLLRRRSAAVRHLVWSLAIVGAILLPIAAALGPSVPVLPARTVAAHDAGRSEPPASDAAGASTDDIGTPAPASRPPAPTAVEASAPMSLPSLLLWAWIAGATLLFARFAIGFRRVRGIARRSVPALDPDWMRLTERVQRAAGTAIDLRVSDEIEMPFASGLLGPTIVLPVTALEWSADRREAVLLHELAHLSRGDLLMNALSHCARALYWFNPLAWYASHRLRIEGERAADDVVLRRGARASDYADHLLSIASSGAAGLPTAALAMARRSAFEGRLLAILEPGVERAAPSRLRVALSTAALLVVILPLAAASPTARAAAMPASPGAAVPAVPTQEPAPSQEPASPAASGPREQQRPESSPVLALMDALTDASADVRLAAVGSLGSLEDPRAIAALGKALREDSDPRVRAAAAEALGEIDDPRAVPHLVGALRTEQVADVRQQIVEALSEIDDPTSVSAIIAVTKDPDVGVRRAAVGALGELEDRSAIPAIIAMARDQDAEVRRLAAEGIGDLEATAGLDALVSLVTDGDADVRQAAVHSLGNLEDPRSLNALVGALRDASPDVRSAAADAIHNIPDMEKAPRQLIEALADADADVRQNVAHALGGIGDEAAVPALKRALADSNVEVRRSVADALAEIGGADAITALMGLLKDPDPEIRRTAAEALGKRR